MIKNSTFIYKISNFKEKEFVFLPYAQFSSRFYLNEINFLRKAKFKVRDELTARLKKLAKDY